MKNMNWRNVYKGLGGALGLSVIGVGSYFTFRAIWPFINKEEGAIEPDSSPLLLSEFAMSAADPVTSVVKAEGWRWGIARTIDIVEVESGFFLSTAAAPRYIQMRDAAKAQGVTLKLNTAYRTMPHQRRLWDTYQTNLAAWERGGRQGKKPTPAAKPGWSNHQMGLALDVESANGTNAAFHWLTANAGQYGFKRTVASEPWHWEFA